MFYAEYDREVDPVIWKVKEALNEAVHTMLLNQRQVDAIVTAMRCSAEGLAKIGEEEAEIAAKEQAKAA